LSPNRREFIKRGLVVAAGVSVPGLLDACSPRTTKTKNAHSLQALADSKVQSGSRQALDALVAVSDLALGFPNYVAFGLLPKGGPPLTGLDAKVWLAPSPNPASSAKVMGPLAAPWRGYAKPEATSTAPKGVNALEIPFDKPGIWSVLIEVQSQGRSLLASTALQVKPRSETKQPGDKALATLTPTVADNHGVSPICTKDPPCSMHQVTLAQALETMKPTAFIVATPRFCKSRTCGPNLEELIVVQQAIGDRANFVHAEVYKDDNPETVTQEQVSPTYKEWGLDTDPWLYLIDKQGTIASRYEGPITAAQIQPALARLLS